MLEYDGRDELLHLVTRLSLAEKQPNPQQYLIAGIEILEMARKDDLYVSQYINLSALIGNLGCFSLSIGDLVSAIDYSSQVWGEYRHWAVFNRAYAYFFSHQYERAYRDASDVLTENDSIFIYYLKAAARWLMGDRIGAIPDIQTAICVDASFQGDVPEDCHGYFVRGLVRGWTDQSRAAMKDFFTCVQICEKTKDQYLKPHAVRLFQKLREKQKTAIVDGLG